jgi:hypothetical protein
MVSDVDAASPEMLDVLRYQVWRVQQEEEL